MPFLPLFLPPKPINSAAAHLYLPYFIHTQKRIQKDSWSLEVTNVSKEESSDNNSTSIAWDAWEPTASTNSRLLSTFFATTASPAETSSAAVTATRQEASLANPLMFLSQASTATHDRGFDGHPPQHAAVRKCP